MNISVLLVVLSFLLYLISWHPNQLNFQDIQLSVSGQIRTPQ